jgi:uncharacterized hydrophobic protein (TIGR00341 family)
VKIIEVVADKGHVDTVTSIAAQQEVDDLWLGPVAEDGRQAVRMLVSPEKRQAVLDALQGVLSASEHARILVIPVEAALPRVEPAEDEDKARRAATTTREELYDSVEKGARLNSTFVLLVALSTIVAAIGLIEDNVAVVIGAMVIAPLLGPNIALALASALGDTNLMWRSLRSSLAGLGLALLISIAIALVWPVGVESRELLARTNVGLDGVALALAAGAAAVLSLTTGLSSVLVGVMVAVALLPPAATMGLMLGSGQYEHAAGAGLLLAVNIVCVNLAAKIVLLARGVKPRTWLAMKKARQSLAAYIAIWVISLAVLIVVIYQRGTAIFGTVLPQ